MRKSLLVAAAAGVGNGYMIRIANRLAQMNGWAEEQVTALRAGTPTGGAKIDTLTGLVKEAATKIRETLRTPPGRSPSKAAGAMRNWPMLSRTWEQRFSRDTSSTTHKRTWTSEWLR